MATIARKRRAVWPDRDAVRASYAEPAAVRRRSRRESLDAYLRWGFVDRADGQVELACAPEVEATIFEVSRPSLRCAPAAWRPPRRADRAGDRRPRRRTATCRATWFAAAGRARPARRSSTSPAATSSSRRTPTAPSASSASTWGVDLCMDKFYCPGKRSSPRRGRSAVAERGARGRGHRSPPGARAPVAGADPRGSCGSRGRRRPSPASVGETRQKVNYHLKELERVGLVAPVGERRSGNFIETLYEAARPQLPRLAAGRVVRPAPARRAAPAALAGAPGDGGRAVCSGTRSRCSTGPRSTASRSPAPRSKSTSTSPTRRTAPRSSTSTSTAVQELCDRYGGRDGLPYRVVLAAHPASEPDREGRAHDNDYEKTFSVRVPPERRVPGVHRPDELEQWFTPKFDADAEEGAPGVKADAASPGATCTSRSPRSRTTSCCATGSGRRIRTPAST